MEVTSCLVCRQATEPDGYGEPVHKDTGLYGAYDSKGNLLHMARVGNGA